MRNISSASSQEFQGRVDRTTVAAQSNTSQQTRRSREDTLCRDLQHDLGLFDCYYAARGDIHFEILDATRFERH
jgi:hypothetical protein